MSDASCPLQRAPRLRLLGENCRARLTSDQRRSRAASGVRAVRDLGARNGRDSPSSPGSSRSLTRAVCPTRNLLSATEVTSSSHHLEFLVRMFDGAMSETKQEAGWQPSSPTHETEQSRRSSIVLAAEEVRLIRNRPPVKPVDVTPIKLTLPAQRQTVSSPSFGPGKRLTTVISQTGSSAKQSSLKLQNYILSPESNPRLPTFGEASGGVIYSPSQG